MRKTLSLFGDETRFHHVGLAVRSIRDVLPDCDPHTEKGQGVRIAFAEAHGMPIEFLEPLDDSSPIARNLKDGVKLLHLCYEVPDLQAALKAGRAAGFHRLGKPVRSEMFEGRQVAWVYSKQFGLFELLEQHPAPAGTQPAP